MLINKDSTSSIQEKVLLVKQANKRTFFEALDQRDKTKIVIWDADLMKLFSQFVTFTDLKNDHYVLEMFTLQKMPQIEQNHLRDQKIDHLIYICRPDLKKIEQIVQHFSSSFKINAPKPQKGAKILTSASSTTNPHFHIFFVPRSSTFGESKLKESDVLSKFDSIIDLPIYLFTWDDDVLNLENDRAFCDLLINGETSDCLYDISRSLGQLRHLFGHFGEIFFKGDMSKVENRRAIVSDLYNRWKDSSKNQNSDQEMLQSKFKIDRVLILDRSVDLITPLITQLTYEGLIDEYYDKAYGLCKFPAEKFGANDQPSTSQTARDGKFKELQLNSNDEMFNELRNLNFNAIGSNLSKKLKQLSEIKMQIQSAQTVRECKEFVKKIPQLKSAEQLASIHVTIAEILKEKTGETLFLDSVNCEQEILNLIDIDRPLQLIEDLTVKAESMNKVLRLICLQSQVSDGLKKKLLDQYRREFLHSFGYQHLNLLCNLQKAGILKTNGSSSGKKFEQVRKDFKLIVDGVNEQTPDDISYVYSGYAPLLIRLCQQVQKMSTLDSVLEVFRKLPGASGGSTHPEYDKKPSDKKVYLVVFVGGTTCAEISALRFLSQLNENISYFVLTTSMLNGGKIVDLASKF